MTAAGWIVERRRHRMARAWVAAAGLVAGVAAIVGARWLATPTGIDPLLLGAAFGVALSALAIAGAGTGAARLRRPWAVATPAGRLRQPAVALAAGAAFGLALVGLALAGPALTGTAPVPGLGRPAAAFMPWAAVTVLVASAEEVLLRGVLLHRASRAAGIVPAVILTSAVFALMHVPLYGWHVVPLDVGVGVALAGLRLTTGSLVAPSAAHAVADLATWWL